MRSKFVFVLILMSAFLNVGYFGSRSAQQVSASEQSNSSTNQVAKDDQIEEIITDQESWVTKIDSDDISNMKQSVVDSTNASLPGVVTGYHDGVEIKKITSVYLGETGRTERFYYFQGGALFYVKTQRFDYKVPIYIDAFAGISETIINEYHIFDGKIIKWSTTRTAIVPEDSTRQERLNELTSFSRRYRELLKNMR